MMVDEPFVAWPGWRHLAYATGLIVLVSILFFIVYGGADYLTARRAHHFQLIVPAELSIPLWPWTIVVYDSLYLFFLLAPFVLRTDDSFRRLARSATVTILFAGLCFLLIPAKLGFPVMSVTGRFQTLFELSDRVNLDYNLVPSLHVGLTVLCLLAFWPRASAPLRAALSLWALALASSTLLTHQHHVLDIASGAGVAAWVARR